MSNNPYGTQPTGQPDVNDPYSQPSAPVSQPSAPWSQPSASYPQPSASYPQPSGPAGQPGSQPSAMSQPSASWEHTAPLPTMQPQQAPGQQFGAPQQPLGQQAPQQTQGQQPQGATAAWAQPLVDNFGKRAEGGLKAVFDLGFRTYATPTVAKIIYILVIAASVLSWVGGAFGGITTGIRMMDSYGGDEIGALFVGLGVVGLLFGWIPALLQIVFTRIFLELALANIRTAEDVDAIRTKMGA